MIHEVQDHRRERTEEERIVAAGTKTNQCGSQKEIPPEVVEVEAVQVPNQTPVLDLQAQL